jgi:glutamine amidotransferase
MIAVIDYGLGNLMSVAGAIEKIGHEAVVTSTIDDLERADKLILPGVGAFADGMKKLDALGLIAPLSDLVLRRRKPILGICLGFQLMAEESYEFGHHRGLGWIDASVVRIEPEDPELRVPHVGWNECLRTGECVLMRGIPEDALYYYVHSYHVRCRDGEMVSGVCRYGTTITAVAARNNIYATQFHPEKSQLAGLSLLRNFVENT